MKFERISLGGGTPDAFDEGMFGIMVFLSLMQLPSFAQSGSDLDLSRRIWRVMDSRAADFATRVPLEDIEVKGGVGRMTVNHQARFSYYIHTEHQGSPLESVLLLPLATSRFTPYYYSTQEWWLAHKNEILEAKEKGLPTPFQPADEVVAWLKEKKLSTNPSVYHIDSTGVKTQPLKDFLFDIYRRDYSGQNHVRLYRGGERPGETEDWLAKRRPKGVRYWTPTLSYALRYAEKNPHFIAELVSGKPPLFLFEIPQEDFRNMISGDSPALTLGVELPKKVHDAFDKDRQFKTFSGSNHDYAGIGSLGIELEVRSDSDGVTKMIKHFSRPVSIQEIVEERLEILQRAKDRLSRQRPQSASFFERQFKERRERAIHEGRLVMALQAKASRETVMSLTTVLEKDGGISEIFDQNTTKALQTYVKEHMQNFRSRPSSFAQEQRFLNASIRPWNSCSRVFN